MIEERLQASQYGRGAVRQREDAIDPVRSRQLQLRLVHTRRVESQQVVRLPSKGFFNGVDGCHTESKTGCRKQSHFRTRESKILKFSASSNSPAEPNRLPLAASCRSPKSVPACESHCSDRYNARRLRVSVDQRVPKRERSANPADRSRIP